MSAPDLRFAVFSLAGPAGGRSFHAALYDATQPRMPNAPDVRLHFVCIRLLGAFRNTDAAERAARDAGALPLSLDHTGD